MALKTWKGHQDRRVDERMGAEKKRGMKEGKNEGIKDGRKEEWKEYLIKLSNISRKITHHGLRVKV